MTREAEGEMGEAGEKRRGGAFVEDSGGTGFKFAGRTQRIGPLTARNPEAPKVASKASWGHEKTMELYTCRK